MRDLIYGVLLSSDNTLALAGAEKVSGSESIFVDRMNERAAEIGMSRTIFKTPHGRDPEDIFDECVNKGVGLNDINCAHYSTPRDLAILAHAALPKIRDFVERERYEITTWKDKFGSAKNITIRNTNRLLRGGGSNFYAGAYGVKTGTTDRAGRCLVSAAERGSLDIIAVVLGSNANGDSDGDRYTDSRTLLDWGFAQAFASSLLRAER